MRHHEQRVSGRRSFRITGVLYRAVAVTPILLGTAAAWAGYNPTVSSFTLVAIPDPQYYTNQTDAIAQNYYNTQMQWVVNNQASRNIAFVVGLGDVQQDGDPYLPDGTPSGYVPNPNDTWEKYNIPANSTLEWDRARAAWDILDKAGVPYYTVPGNHDYLHWDQKKYPTYWNQYFGPQHYAGKPWFGGASPADPSLGYSMNAYNYIQAGGHTFLNIALQFAPSSTDLAWAQSIINANKGMPTIVTTHDYQDNNGRDGTGDYIWNNLINANPQVFMVLSGHVNGVHQQTSVNSLGQSVFEMLSDYQDYGFSGYANGGGYLRTLTFDLANNNIHVQSYSPYIASQGGNGYLTSGTGAGANDFTLAFNFNQRFSALADVPGITVYWDPRQSGGANPGGSGTWDGSTTNWFDSASNVAWRASSSNDQAIFGGTGGTVTLANTAYVNRLTFQNNTYTLTSSTGALLDMMGTTPTIDTGNGNVTISAPIGSVAGIAKVGSGTLTLSGSNIFAGGLTIQAGQVNFSADANLGANGVTLNGGILSYTGNVAGGLVESRQFTVASGGGTIDIANAGPSNGKLVITGDGSITGSGALTKTGQGWLTVYGSNTGFAGSVQVRGGVIELGNSAGLGSAPITLNGGELSANTTSTITNAITVNSGTSGTLSTDGQDGTFGGTITANGSLTLRLGDFWGSTNRNLTLNSSSKLAGSGSISLASGNGASPSAQVLTLVGSNSGFTGTLNVAGGYNVLFANANSVPGKITVTSSATALPGISVAFNAAPPAITDNTGSTGGVFAYNGGAYTQPLDMSKLYNGHWYLGSLTGGTYWSSSLLPAADATYRLGGAGGRLVIANSNVVTGNNQVVIGAPMTNGGGTIQFMGTQNYQGATTINNGTLQVGANNAIPTGTSVTFGNGAYNGTLDLNGFNQTLTSANALRVASGATAANQVIGNSSTTANSTLTIDTSRGSTTFDGVIRDTLGSGNKTVALTVQGTNPSNALILTGSHTYGGGTTINGGALQLGNGGTSGAISGNVSNKGSLIFNRSDAVSFAGQISGTGNVIQNGTGTLTLTAGNTFSGGLVINRGTVASPLSMGTNSIGTGTVTLAGGRLALQGQQAMGASIAPIAVSGFTLDTIYAAGDTGKTPPTLMDGYYSFYQNGYTPLAGSPNAGTALTGGLPGQNITSGVLNSVYAAAGQSVHTPFALQSLTANNTLQLAQNTSGTLTLTTPTAYRDLAILATSSYGGSTTDTPSVKISFADGTSVTTQYKAYDWFVGTDAAKASANALGNGTSGGIGRYSPTQTPGWDTRAFGLYETDINLTNIGGVDYSGKAIASLAFTGGNYDTGGREKTNVFAVSGSTWGVITQATQTYANNVAVTSDSTIDVTASLNAVMGSLSVNGSKLHITSADTTTTPYSMRFGATSITGGATFDVANSTGGGTGILRIGSVSGTDGLTKTGAGTLELTDAANSYTGGTTIAGGTLIVDGNLTGGSITIASGAALSGTGTITLDLTGFLPDRITNAGLLDLTNLHLAVNTSDLQSLGQYTLIDSPGGTMTGQPVITGLQPGWSVSYTPTSVIVSVPEPTGLGIVALGFVGLLHRRRRNKAGGAVRALSIGMNPSAE